MKKILIYKYIDIFNASDYSTLNQTFKNKYNGQCPNFGNKLWYQGLISEISTEDNYLTYYNNNISIEQINSEFDMILYPMANIFSTTFAQYLPSMTDFFNRIKIPVYIISCGAEANTYDELNQLVSAIGDVSTDFIKSIYNTNGDFALRGYFTAEFFNELGFNNLNVVGCPSLFQNGSSLFISNSKIKREDFCAAINGRFDLAVPLLKDYNSIYYDQDILFDIMYNKEYYDQLKDGIKGNLRWLRTSGFKLFLPELILSNRIRLLADMWDWRYSLQHEEITFSFGTRIHGNIMALLSGIPCVIVNIDTRVKEMAEFYNIPNIDYFEATKLSQTPNALYDLYLKTDYSDFNRTYPGKFNSFNEFLQKCGIVDSINTNNSFWDKSNGEYPVSAIDEAIAKSKEIMNNKLVYSLLLSLIDKLK